MSFDPNRPAEPAAPTTPPAPATPADPAWPATSSAPGGATERVPFTPAAPEPGPVPTAPVAAAGPVITPGPAASSRKSSSGGRLLNVVLIVAAAVAVGGVAFAVGRNTAPVSASTGAGRGNGNFGGAVAASRPAPAAQPGFVRGGFGGALGGAGLTIQGTVESVDGDTLTIKTATGADDRGLDRLRRPPITRRPRRRASDVQTGSTVQVQVDLAGGAGGGGFRPGASGAPVRTRRHGRQRHRHPLIEPLG